MADHDSRDFNTAHTGSERCQVENVDQSSSIESDSSLHSTETDHTLSSTPGGTSQTIDNFLGKKFFEYVLAEAVLATAQPNAASHQLEAKLAAIVNAFPYQDGLDEIHALKPSMGLPMGASDPGKQYSTFVTNLGTLVRQSDPRSKNDMGVMIRKRGMRDFSEARTQNKDSSNRRTSRRPQNLFHVPPSVFDDGLQFEPFTPPRQEIELARSRQHLSDSIDWVSKLNLDDQSQDSTRESRYEYRTLDNGDHIAQVNIGGTKRYFQGTAKKKGDAKQMAAEKACNFLRL
ncbi:uncharacterized protein RCC_01222 [Ramularia collo-cygni]|uniref:Uncharacterized protein n=1 Tax=Ramularia collo-cygni TaxID=112498 RepID=A0A2D3V1J0_9PEZI|nr:uncharacterized protein RCC_01222 [Ramularia collo-cygni]CZT15359.1 uncharacterized protein RCC_01222 [Ramularia collo-cygni]